MASLQSYLKDYLKNQKISDYEGWVSLYGKDAKREYGEAKRAAENRYAASLAEYGERAASLAARGLTGSGYSDYLNTVALTERARATENALANKKKTEIENQKGYLSYLQSASEPVETTSAETAALNELLKREISDKTSAVTFLTTARGFDKETANRIADQAITIYRGSDSYRKYVTSQAVSQGYLYEDAYKFALLQGLSPAMADEIAKISTFVIGSHKFPGMDANLFY